jgi:transposase
VEIILGQARRHWSEDEKRALVAETETVNGVARRHNISRSMLFGWRKQYRERLKRVAPASTPIGFTPVAIAGPDQSELPTQPRCLQPYRLLSWSLDVVFVCAFPVP